MTPHGWVAVVAVLLGLSLVPVLWAIVDVVRRPAWQFSPGRKMVWACMFGLGWLLVWPVALVLSVVYLTVLRRRFPPVGAGGMSQPPPRGSPYGSPSQPPPPPPPLPPAGWYPDPAGSPQERWWDGRGWSEHLR